jgi:hypothetical protein
MKINNDLKETIKISTLFLFQSYKVIMGSMLILFVPQNCNNEVCSITDNLNKNDTFHNITLSTNILCVLLFIICYGIELKREKWCVNYLDIDHNIADNNLELVIKDKPQILLPLQKYNKLYLISISITSSVYLINLILSSIIIYNNYVGIQAVTSYSSYVVLILLKIYNSLFVSYSSLKNKKALSGYLTEFSSFNIIDKDYQEVYIINKNEIKENHLESIKEEDIKLETNP